MTRPKHGAIALVVGLVVVLLLFHIHAVSACFQRLCEVLSAVNVEAQEKKIEVVLVLTFFRNPEPVVLATSLHISTNNTHNLHIPQQASTQH